MIKRIIALLAVSTMFLGAAHARKVSGTVTCGEEFLEGVIVTDGANFTTTNFKGKFAFEINDDAEHVYIVTPDGYVADWTSGVPAFYQKAEGKNKFAFDLQKMQKGTEYHIIAIADPQTSTPEHSAKFGGAPVEDLTATAAKLEGVTVGLALGDICWDDLARLDDYRKDIVKTGVPFYPVVGNHDNSAWCNGDLEGSKLYRGIMGPENYAFYLGKDLVIVLDNIIYDTNFKHQVGYADHVIAWVKGLMAYVPAGAEIYIAQHAPTMHGKRKIHQANQLLDIVRGRKVTFLSGHTHVNNNFTIEKNITEHNIAAICGAWWDTELCTDGTPKGYKVFTKSGDRLTWYYKGVGLPKSHIADVAGPGESEIHPNSVVVNVWDWDPQWKVEWYEDGVLKGSMDQVVERSSAFKAQIEAAYKAYGQEIPGWKQASRSRHYFTATPSRYARRVTVSVQSRFGQKWTKTVDLTGFVEEHAVCQDATFENVKAAAVNGANSVAFPLYAGMDGVVRVGGADGPVLTELIDSTDAVLSKEGRSPLRYHLLMRTVAGKEEGRSVPYHHAYADAVMDSLWTRFLDDRLLIACSDYRALNHLNSRYPEVDLAFKVDQDVEDIEKAMSKLKFTPRWISVHYTLFNEDFLDTYRQKGYCVAVWGIPDEETKNRIKAMGPDAVIF